MKSKEDIYIHHLSNNKKSKNLTTSICVWVTQGKYFTNVNDLYLAQQFSMKSEYFWVSILAPVKQSNQTNE